MEVAKDQKIGPKRHWVHAYWWKVEAGINELIANRGKELKFSATVKVDGRTCQWLGENQG